VARNRAKAATVAGFKVRSGLEATVIEAARQYGDIEYETEKLWYSSPYTPDCKLPNGILIEIKGYFTAKDRAKMVKVIRDNPDRDIRMVFQANNKIHRKSDMRYANWCNKRDIPYAIGGIPSDWFEEEA